MYKFILILFFFSNFFSLFSQFDFSGNWQGVIFRDGFKEQDALIFYINIKNEGGKVVGKSREELYLSDFYAVQKISGLIKNDYIEIKENVIESKKSSTKISWCNAIFKGKYIDTTGYIVGTFTSNTCKRYSGRFVLFKSKAVFSDKKDAVLGHAWRDKFINDYKKGIKSPELLEKERNNFVFKPIYFEFDKFEICEEYFLYLKKMIEIVNNHSDLRILVTGHTDSDGSDKYNDELSFKRAKAIEIFFKENGLDLKKLKIDYRGEKEPIDSNETKEGKHRNRRVDFSFIYY